MQKERTLWVLLATYNSEKYLRLFLDSLMASMGSSWRLIVRDDRSNDASLHILEEFKALHKQQVYLLPNNEGNLGVIANFSKLLGYAIEVGDREDLFLLADQDDVWCANKRRVLEKAYDSLSIQFQKQPLLIHSDLCVVDSNGAQISDSLVALQHTEPSKNQLRNLLVQNTVTGCSALFNYELLESVIPIPDDVVMHDWWMALVASSLGKIVYVPDQLVKYRQHEKNVVGARKYGYLYFFHKLMLILVGKSDRVKLQQLVLQAQKLRLAMSGKNLNPEDQHVLDFVAGLPEHTRLSRLSALRDMKIHRTGIMRNLLLYLDVALFNG